MSATVKSKLTMYLGRVLLLLLQLAAAF